MPINHYITWNIALSFCLLSFSMPLYAIEIYAHRGASGLVPEHSLAAYELALNLGVQAIDMDVGLTKDGVVVVSHDSRLNPELTRDANGQWLTETGPALKDLEFAALQQYDVGRIKPQSPYQALYPIQLAMDNIRIPSLQQVIQRIKSLGGHSMRYQIEIKTNPLEPQYSPEPQEIVPAILAILDAENVVEQSEIHSSDWRNMQLVQMLEPRIITSYITEHSVHLNPTLARLWSAGHTFEDHPSLPSMIAKLGGKIWCPNHQELDAQAVQQAHQHGLRVNVWTVDDPQTMLKMIEYGVDAIITNRPDILQTVLATLPTL